MSTNYGLTLKYCLNKIKCCSPTTYQSYFFRNGIGNKCTLHIVESKINKKKELKIKPYYTNISMAK